MKKIKFILYIILPLIVIVIVIKEFLLKIKIDTKEAIQLGVGIIIAMWFIFFIISRLLNREIRRKNVASKGFQIIHKTQQHTDSQPEEKPLKFYSSGRFQIIHPAHNLQLGEKPKVAGYVLGKKREEKQKDKIEKKVHFGTAGIRGITNIEITPLMVLKISEIYGSYLSNIKTGDKIKLAVGYDSRYGSDMLKNAAISGLNSAGIHTTNCGCITTGGLASYIVCNKLDGGILITGSHTPYNMTGFIILNADGSYLDIEHSRELENRYENYDKFRNAVKPEQIGNNQEAQKPFECYKSFLLERVDSNLIKSKQYRVLVDPANGPATLILPDILKELGCSVFLLNEQLSAIPNRPSEPRAKNLVETAAKVKEYKCDLGIATDVDADRVLFIDAEGKVLSEDLVGAIFARSVISSSKICVTPINSSFLIEKVISDCGGRLEYCRIGQPETITVIKECGASFSYEESGKYYFCNDAPTLRSGRPVSEHRGALWPDALLSSLKLLEIMAKSNKSLARIASEFPQFYQVKHILSLDLLKGNTTLAPETRHGQGPCPTYFVGCVPRTHLNIDKIFQKVEELWHKEVLENSIKDVTIDGLKRIYNDKSWLLIRKSGTEPLIRVYADAPSLDRAEQLVKLGEDLVKKAVQQT